MKALFHRDLTRLIQEIEAFPSDEMLWATLPGIANPAGNLALHLEGNLREFIGRLIGGVAYERERPKEFSSTGLGRAEIAARIAQVRELVPPIIESMDPHAIFPQAYQGITMTNHDFVVHVLTHFNWHLGQIDYMRRALSGQGPLALQGL
ncbi:MAG: DinB family protein [Acidobacteria bacterium]|nr:DinB family protein [Acidobacteriota bacterium]